MRVRRVAKWVNLPALVAVLIWGAVFPFGKFALAEFPPLAFAALRPLIGAWLLMGFLLARGDDLRIERRDWARLLVAGVGGVGVFQWFTFVGLGYTSASHSALLYATSPLLGAAILWVASRQAPGRWSLAGLLLGFAGVTLLILGGEASAGGATLLGDLMTLVGALAWVVVTVVPAPLVRRYGAVPVTAWLILLAALAMLPTALEEIWQVALRPPSPLAWLAVLYIGVMGIVVANALWQRAVRALGPTAALVYVYVEPLVAVGLAALLLGERLDPVQLLGAVVLLVGVGVVQRA